MAKKTGTSAAPAVDMEDITEALDVASESAGAEPEHDAVTQPEAAESMPMHHLRPHPGVARGEIDENVLSRKTSQPYVPQQYPEPTPDDVPVEFPNPLGLALTECHLPEYLVSDRKRLLRYIGSHTNKNKVARYVPSPNEQRLYRSYAKLAKKKAQKPILPRSFAAAVRLIAAGKDPSPAPEEPLETFAL